MCIYDYNKMANIFKVLDHVFTNIIYIDTLFIPI